MAAVARMFTTAAPAAVHGTAATDHDTLRAAIEWLPVGVLVVNDDGIIVAVNREIERVFGYADGALIGRAVDALVPDAARPGHELHRQGFAGEPRVRSLGENDELFGRRHDGSEVRISIRLAPVRIHQATLTLASITNETDRRQAQIALDDRLAFERVVGELGADFVNMRPEDVDHAVEDALGRVVRTLDIDRSALFQLEAGGDFVHVQQATRPGCAPALPRISARHDFPWHLARLRAGHLVSFTHVSEVPSIADRETLRRLGTKSALTIPLVVEGQPWGALSFSTVREPCDWPAGVINRLRVVALIFTNAIARKIADERLRKTVESITTLRDRFREENRYLRDELQRVTYTQAVVGHSSAIRRTLEQVRQAAATDLPVLLVGETGTGKALLAARIHDLSARRDHPMVRVNCAPPTTLAAAWPCVPESSGLATDAAGHAGPLKLANGSTMFFDEVADLPLDAQARLIRVIQDPHEPSSGTPPAGVAVRIIAATRRDLKRCIREGTFRDDLYYRLNAFPIHVPPLRERPDDIPLLVWRFVDELSATYRRSIDAIDRDSMATLQGYTWPGNARELRNVVEHAMIGPPVSRRLHITIPSNGSTPAAADTGAAATTGGHRRRVRRAPPD